jgi:endonuclease-3
LGQKITDQFAGEVPETMEDLQSLPGVGRKTANVIASVIYNQPAMAVDTHVFRVSQRLGLVPKTANTPLKVEMALIKNLPDEVIATAHHWLILHGRYICLARTPQCAICEITHFCAFYQKNNKE